MRPWLLLIAGLAISFFGSLKDGLSESKKYVGWLDWHIPTWLSRDIPLWVIAIVLAFEGYWGWLLGLLLLVSRSFHRIIERYITDNIRDYYGNPLPPGWWYRLRRLWGWLPWM